MNITKIEDTNLIRITSYASVIVAAVLIIMKLFGWWLTNSVSLQASLIDSLLDAIASFVNMFAIYQALKPADKRHSYGHGKIESLAALGQSIFIGASAIWLLYEAYERFDAHEAIQQTQTGLMIMTAAVIISFLLVSFQKYVVQKTQSQAIAADMLHYKADLMVNIAVIISLLSAAFFAVDWLDAVFGILIGIYIFWTAWKIMVSAFNVLLDTELDEEDREKILEIINTHPEVIHVKDLRTRRSGLQQFFQLNLVMDPDISLRKADIAANEVEEEVLKAFPKSEVAIRFVPEIPSEH